jgi:ketosteroid isomerase-like protein
MMRAYFAAYENKDRPAMEALLSDDFTFTSPRDDHINRATYFARC